MTDATSSSPQPTLEEEENSGGLSPEEQRIVEQTERMRLRRESRTKQEQPEEAYEEAKTEAIPEEVHQEEHHFAASADHVIFHQEHDPVPPKDRHVLADPAPLPPVFPVEADSDSEQDDEGLTEAEKEQQAKLRRMEERRLRKHAEEEVLKGYVEVPAASSFDQEERKSENLQSSEPVRIHEHKSTTTTTTTTVEDEIPTAQRRRPTGSSAGLPPVRIVLPPESARQNVNMNAVRREGLMGLTLTFKTGIPFSLAAPLDCGVIVRVRAAGINPVDYKLPKLIGGPGVGFDFAGQVVSVRPDTTPFKVGDEVFGNADGCLADYVVCDANKINLRPKSLTAVEAAAMPTAYLTALQGLRKYLQKGHNVLVIGASGGCGLAAIQIAHKLGASEIVGVCSGKNAELVKQNGATKVIDYNLDKVSTAYLKWGQGAQQRSFDLVFDAATGSGGKEDYFDEAQKVLKPSGKLVCLNGSVSVWLRKFTNYQRANQDLVLVEHSAADLGVLTQMVDAEEEKGPRVRPVIARVLPFNEKNVKEAFDLLKSRRATGKIVLQMDGNANSQGSSAPEAPATTEQVTQVPATTEQVTQVPTTATIESTDQASLAPAASVSTTEAATTEDTTKVGSST